MRKQITIALALSMTLFGTMPAQAAFVIKKANTIEQTTLIDNNNITSTTTDAATYNAADESSTALSTDRSKESKTEKKGYGAAAFILSLLGVGAVVGAILVLPASLLGFILLGLLACLLGFSAIGCSEIDKKSIFPQPALAHIGLALGIIESLPLLAPIFIIYLIYYLCGGGRHKNGFK